MATSVALPGNGDAWVTIAPLFILGCGLGLAYARLNEVGLRRVASTVTGLGSGTLIGARLVAAGLGAVVLAQILLLSATHKADEAIQANAGLSAVEKSQFKSVIQAAARGRDTGLDDVRSDQRVASGLAEISSAYTDGTRLALIVGAGFVGAAAATAYRFPKDSDSTSAQPSTSAGGPGRDSS